MKLSETSPNCYPEDQQATESHDEADTQTHKMCRSSLTPNYLCIPSAYSKMITARKEKLMRKKMQKDHKGFETISAVKSSLLLAIHQTVQNKHYFI